MLIALLNACFRRLLVMAVSIILQIEFFCTSSNSSSKGKEGFPDFSKNLYKNGANDVMIKPTGNRSLDFGEANKVAGYSSTPKGYTWHHHQTTGRMQLVETKVHSQTGHTGGFSLWK